MPVHATNFDTMNRNCDDTYHVLPGGRRIRANSSDCMATATESTATPMSERSSEQDHSAPVNSQRSRTNFGDYQSYIPPDIKDSPTRSRIKVAPSGWRQGLRAPPTGIAAEQREPNFHLPSNRDLLPPPPPPSPKISLGTKREQCIHQKQHSNGQIPFERVWSQQDYNLAEDEKKMEDTYINEPLVDESSVGVHSESSMPFDETPKTMEVSGSSAFSAFPPRQAQALTGEKTAQNEPTTSIGKSLKDGNENNRKDTEGSFPLDHFLMPPPRISGPRVMIGLKKPFQTETTSQQNRKTHLTSEHRDTQVTRTPNQSYHDPPSDIPSDEDGPGKLSEREDKAERSSLLLASKNKYAEDVGADDRKIAEDLRPSQSREADEKSLDSLFEFEGKEGHSRSHNKSSRMERDLAKAGWRSRSSMEASTDDDTSLESQNEGQASRGTSLKARAQEAFESRKRLSPRKTSASPRPSSPRKTATSPKPKITEISEGIEPLKPVKGKAQVSFGAKDTIHHFEHYADEFTYYSDDVDESVFSSSTRETARSEGSEVEEALRDIFLINALGSCGTSSPRKIKYQPDTNQENCDSEQEEDDEENTLQSEDGFVARNRSAAKNDSQTAEKSSLKLSSKKDDPFYKSVISMVEGGFGAVGAAFGFTSDPDADFDPIGPACGPIKTETSRRNNRDRTSRRDSDSGNFEGVIDSVSDYILGTKKSESSEVSSTFMA